MKNARRVLAAGIATGVLSATVATLGVATSPKDPDWDAVQADAQPSLVITSATPDDHAWD